MAEEMKTADKLKNCTFNYTHYFEIPLKLVGCWDWYPNSYRMGHVFTNYVYVGLVLFVLSLTTVMLFVNIHSEWVDVMSGLDNLADTLPYIASLLVVAYFALHRNELYELNSYMNENFKFHSANGLTNMTMDKSYRTAKTFAYTYTVCSLCSAIMYAVVPLVMHWWLKTPLGGFVFMDVTRSPFIEIAFFRQLLAQFFVGLALGQLGVFFASNSILLCGQLDLLCCSVRNVQFTALLQNGVQYGALLGQYGDITKDELYSYMYNISELKESDYHYDKVFVNLFSGRTRSFDIYDKKFDEATESALRECAKTCQVISEYKELFERFVSPLLVLRVVQVTLFLCMLLYAASRKFNMMTVEYLLAVSLDIFIYCYYGNQIIIQADRVSPAVFQSTWYAMSVTPRRTVLNLLLSNKRQKIVRAGGFLPMDLKTYLNIIKTSFSYYTLLVNVNEN